MDKVKDEIIEGNKPFTEEDLDNCWAYYKSYLIDILNGEYDLATAREDLKGLIGSRFDKRNTEETIKTQNNEQQ